jgi:hypothetical protein
VLRSLYDAYLRRRFAWLLALLLAVIGIDPALEALGIPGRGIEWMFALALVAAVAGAVRARRGRSVVVGVCVALAGWLALRVVHFGPDASFGPALLGAAGLGSAAILSMSVLGEGRVDAERICAALCVYLLTGIAFGGLYAALEIAAPGSLSGRAPIGLQEAFYFSFVTLATLGYGDITPVASAPRALAVLEVVFGQLYLAVLIARLVSLYSRER